MKRLIVLLVLVTAPLLQAAQIVGKHGVEILAVDGKKVEQSLFSSPEIDFTEGQHQIVVMYNRRFHNADAVTSKPHILNINIEGKTEISVKAYNNPYRARKAIDDGLEWIVTNSQGATVINNSVPISRKGLFPNSDIEGQIADYNKNNGIVISKETSVATTSPTAVTTATTAIVVATQTPSASKSVTANNNVVKQAAVAQSKTNISNTDVLISTYMKASKKEQKAFRIWMLEQDMSK